MVIENLKELMLKGGGLAKTDDETIIHELEAIGYWAKGFTVEAGDYSSKTARARRLYGCVLEKIRLTTREAYMRNVLRILTLPPHSAWDFVMDELGKARRSKKPRIYNDPLYQDSHAYLFMKKKIPWPPSIEQIKEHKDLDLWHLSQRALEDAYFCAKGFPWKKEEADADGCQYLDLNVGLDRHVGDGDHNPWTSRFGTITTKAIWLMRYPVQIKPGEVEIQYKVLDGGELMQFIGYDERLAGFAYSTVDSQEATLFAGNAMNGFALAAFYIALITSIPVKTEPDDAAASDSEDSAVSNPVRSNSSSSD
jgi:hypothetical protein